MTHFKTTISILAAFALLGIASLAFAHGPGYGRYGGHMMDDDDGYGHMMGSGGGWGHMMGYGDNDYGNVSRKDAAKLAQARNEFFESTRSLRADIRDKQLALDEALQKENPNPETLSNIQKALSKLEGEFDQKALAYRIKVDKMLPEGYRGEGYSRGACWR